MSDATPTLVEQPLPPDTTFLLLTVFADLYRQEVTAAEDVNRTLPFFGTALGIVVAVFDRLRTEWVKPRSRGAKATWRFERDPNAFGSIQSRAISPSSWWAQARHPRLTRHAQDKVVGGGPAPAMTMLGSRHNYRARASLHLVRGLIWALSATTVIFAADKLGILPKVLP